MKIKGLILTEKRVCDDADWTEIRSNNADSSLIEDEQSGQHAEIIEADLTRNIILHLIVQYRMSRCPIKPFFLNSFRYSEKP